MSAHQAAYCYVDPDILASCEPAPIGIDAEMKEILGDQLKDDDGSIRVKLRMHPHLKRWCMYERVKKGGQQYWKVFSIFMHEPVPGQMPSDYQNLEISTRQWYAHFTGMVGEFRLPNRQDFLELKRFDTRRHTTDEIEGLLRSREEQEEAGTESNWEDWQHDFLSYYFRLAMQEANQAAGSCQKPWSNATIPVGENAERWTRVWVATSEKDGYWVRTKKTADQRRIEIIDWLRALAPQIDMRLADEKLGVLRQKNFFREIHLFTLEQLEKAAELAAETLGVK